MVILPDFITNAIQNKNTSLGNNGIFCDNCIPITSILLENRYRQVISAVEITFGYVPTTDEAKSMLSKLVIDAMELEKPLKNQLETLCEATVNKVLGIPQETMLINCELVSKIKPYNALRILPEQYADTEEHTFEEINICGETDSEVLKRRVVNSLVQGISYLLMTATYDNEQINEWSKELPSLYNKIITLNDFLIFTEKETISDKNPMLGAYVETDIGKSNEKTVVDSQGLIYPFLLQETYRGIFESFGTHGLPNNLEDAMNVIRKADFTLAEVWDIRIGVPIWQQIDIQLNDSIEPTIYPYIFSSIVELDCNDFNKLIFGFLTNRTESKQWLEKLVKEIKHDEEYKLFKADIERFNLEKCLITDTDNEDDHIID